MSPASFRGAGRRANGGRILLPLLHVLLTAGGFFGTAAALRPLVPWPYEYGLRSKFEHFAEHGDAYDVVFLGSSRMWRSIIPARFDEDMARRGTPTRSYNFGVGGMRVWEMDYVFRRLVELAPERLHTVLIEGGDWDPDFPSKANTFASRSVYWHDRTGTTQAVVASLRADRPLFERLALARVHLQLYLWKQSNYGQGATTVRALRGLDGRGGDATGVGARPSSYYLGEEGFATQDTRVHPGFRRKVDEYLEDVAHIDAANDAPVDVAHLNTEPLARQHAAARALGFELIHVIPPGIEGAPVRRALHHSGDIAVLFDFNQPGRFPHLFEVEERFSPDHLNLVGARTFTRALAAAFARHRRGEPFEKEEQ